MVGHGQGGRHTTLPLPLLPLRPGGVHDAAVAARLAHDQPCPRDVSLPAAVASDRTNDPTRRARRAPRLSPGPTEARMPCSCRRGAPPVRAAPSSRRRDGDSNPGYPFGVHPLSRRAPSTTRTSLQASGAAAQRPAGPLQRAEGRHDRATAVNSRRGPRAQSPRRGWRRARDSNPRYLAVHLISSQAPSTTRTALLRHRRARRRLLRLMGAARQCRAGGCGRQ